MGIENVGNVSHLSFFHVFYVPMLEKLAEPMLEPLLWWSFRGLYTLGEMHRVELRADFLKNYSENG